MESSKVKCKEHPFIGRFNNEPTVAKSTTLSIELCFGTEAMFGRSKGNPKGNTIIFIPDK